MMFTYLNKSFIEQRTDFLKLHNFYAFSDLIMIKLSGIIIYRNGDLNK